MPYFPIVVIVIVAAAVCVCAHKTGKEIDPSVLPTKYGGDCEYVFNLNKFLYADPYLSKDPNDPRKKLYC